MERASFVKVARRSATVRIPCPSIATERDGQAAGRDTVATNNHEEELKDSCEIT
jgi:hypothetical protein